MKSNLKVAGVFWFLELRIPQPKTHVSRKIVRLCATARKRRLALGGVLTIVPRSVKKNRGGFDDRLVGPQSCLRTEYPSSAEAVEP